MRRAVEMVTRSLYVLAAAVYLVLGVVVLLLGTGVLPAWIHDRVFELGRSDPFTMHQIQEMGTLWVLASALFLILGLLRRTADSNSPQGRLEAR